MLIEISDNSQSGEARRKAAAFAAELGIDPSRQGAVALAATEMATNLVKHAGKGYILLQKVGQNGRSGLQMLSVDSGPGIVDISKALEDGHSTAGTIGSGLGTIQRMADAFELYSIPNAGTVVRAEFWHSTAGQRLQPSMQVGVVSEPIPGEEVCGDGWSIRVLADAMLFMVVDGSGHGTLAAEAAREAEKVLAEATVQSLPELVHEAHAALRKTRGAALAVAKIDAEKGLLRFAGVGNIAASIVSADTSRSMVSHNGIVGQVVTRLQEFTYPWNPDSILVMHSDGLGTRWDLQRYPGILSKHPSVISAILHRDHWRGRDDVTVLVAKSA
jgi:anti-sigma regulatory factor (Ser/Thr protein kinase)